jgi:hypothetical protein
MKAVYFQWSQASIAFSRYLCVLAIHGFLSYGRSAALLWRWLDLGA